MRTLERFAVSIRRHPLVSGFDGVWRVVRPLYRLALRTRSKGLERNINGTDVIRVLPELYNLPEVYEPEVWSHIMSDVGAGDRVADVGAYVGLYTLAIAKRVGPGGAVHAFEADPATADVLRRQCVMNGVASVVRIHPFAITDFDGRVSFASGMASESHIISSRQHEGETEAHRLDSLLPDSVIDIMKIDVEGFEVSVIRGAGALLSDPQRRPRILYIEVHPSMWPEIGTSSEDLLDALRSAGYRASHLDGSPVSRIEEYGEICAQPVDGRIRASR
jgi:FkbM family methyltransferase